MPYIPNLFEKSVEEIREMMADPDFALELSQKQKEWIVKIYVQKLEEGEK
jgi:DNA-directed RNA polymerase alpha subunit